MRKLPLLVATLASLYLFSCKKENKSSGAVEPTSTTTADKKYPVGFSLSADFSQSITNIHSLAPKNPTAVLATSQDSLKQNIQYLYYFLFDANNKLLHQITQQASDANFGSIVDTLSPGTYTAQFIGSKYVPYFDFDASTKLIQTYNAHFPAFSNDWPSTYVKQYNLVVGNTNQQQKLVLDHAEAQLLVNLLDTIPANVATINVNFNYKNVYPFLATTTAFNSYHTTYNMNTTITSAQRSAGGFQQLATNLVGPDLITVAITAFDSNGHALYQAGIPAVNLVSGKKTVLSGYLFKPNNGGSGGFSVGAQPLGGTSTTINFAKSQK